jgi:hypothetical protein
MNISASILFLLIPVMAAAQNYQGMNEEDMQKMMEQMKKMEACMQHVDQTKLKALEQRSRTFKSEVKSLCDSGERDTAQKKAIVFGKEFANDPTMKEMTRCSDMMKGMIPEMPPMDKDTDYSDHHVCDDSAFY